MKVKYNRAVKKSNPEVIDLELPELDNLDEWTKIIRIKEFREFGYLQELNRLFLHPLGLTLVVKVTDDGEESLLHIADYRKEGIKFDDALVKTREFKKRIKNVEKEFEKRLNK